jgi:hypothetical protein
MTSGVAEQIDEEIRTSINDGRGLIGAGRYIDHPEYLDDPLNPIEIPKLALQCRQDRQPSEPGSPVALIEGQISADLSANQVFSIDGSMTSNDNQTIIDNTFEIVTRGRKHCWKHKTKFDQSL